MTERPDLGIDPLTGKRMFKVFDESGPIPKHLLTRILICPICGTRVRVPVSTPSSLPEVHKLPNHEHGPGGNLCQGLQVTVTIDLDNCSKCGVRCSKHPSGRCQGCFGELSHEGQMKFVPAEFRFPHS